VNKHLRTLAKADTLAFGGVGFVGTILPETAAFDALSAQIERGDGDALRPELERLLTKATPAGKLYAALLLARLDPEAGRATWQRLAGDRSPVRTFSGCVMGQTTVGEYAAGNGAAR
jgi:hypothetical protein